jgi:hypothetical protein
LVTDTIRTATAAIHRTCLLPAAPAAVRCACLLPTTASAAIHRACLLPVAGLPLVLACVRLPVSHRISPGSTTILIRSGPVRIGSAAAVLWIVLPIAVAVAATACGLL